MSFVWSQFTCASCLGLILLGGIGCSANVKAALGPSGSHVLTCGSGMAACVNKAAKICGEDGYVIIEGTSRSKLLGGESSSYREMSEVAELTVRCGLPEDGEEETQIVYKLPERTDAPIVAQEPIAPVAGSVCAPGATLACVGPGACQGGQVCLESGNGYGACDCGESGPKEPASERANGASTSPTSGPSTVDEKKSGTPADPSMPAVPGIAPTPTPLGQQK